MPEENELDEDIKKKKKREKKEKKKEKKAEKDASETEDEEETLGSKIAIFFITIFIILIWLAIIAVLIKSDVGGFGSSVLYPMMKDVPYLNKILPEPEGGEEVIDTQYQYDSLEDAVARIKELELALDEAVSVNAENADIISQLEQQIAELAVYKEEQDQFELEKEKFYEEVVLSDNAPDINEYRAYYESIDPENAEVLYKQVVEQLAYDDELKDYALTYSSMKPKEAAEIFNTMTDNLNLVANILLNMDADSRADILGQMDAETAAALTKIMEPER